ncbi:hypothetical protein TNCV_2144351 [Trichonephila clavipes]|nr:hypothetical protein TNCV_2144351 [Trichonephila clavipes]
MGKELPEVEDALGVHHLVSTHEHTIVLIAEIESGFVAKDDLVPFRSSQVSSCVVPILTQALMGGLKGSTGNGRLDPKCPSARQIRMVLEDIGASSKGTYMYLEGVR